MITAIIKNITPIPIAIPLIIWTNRSNSCFIKVSDFSPCVVFNAILPIALLPPVLTTTPFPTPSVQFVLKNATFLII